MHPFIGILRPDRQLEFTSGIPDGAVIEGGVHLAVLAHTTDMPSPRVLLDHYPARDSAHLRDDARDCAFVLFDIRSHTLTLARDAMGVIPLYYVANREGFAFGTRIADLIAAFSNDIVPNRRALAALLVDYDAAPIGETYFDGVRSVPPGATLIYRDGRITISPANPSELTETTADYADVVDRFAGLFRAAVARRLDRDAPTAMLVSGGLDSASIISCAAGANVFGITYGMEDGSQADESRYIRALQDAGACIERVPFYPTTDANGIEQSVREGETPAIDHVTLTLQRAAGAARAAGARSIMLGTWGDQVLSPFPPPYIARIAPWRTARLHALAHSFQQYMTDVPEAEIYRAFQRSALRRRAPAWYLERRRAQQRSRSIFDVLAHDFPAAPLGQTASTFGEAVRQNTTRPAQVDAIEGTTKWGWANGINARVPFLDSELVRFLETVPDRHAYRAHMLKPLLRDAMQNVVPAAVLARRDKGDYTDAIRRGSISARDQIEQLGGLNDLVRFGLMSRASADKTLARLHNRSEIGPSIRQLEQLTGVSAWLRVFFPRK